MATEINANIPKAKQFTPIYDDDLPASTVNTLYLRLDPRKITSVQINVNSNEFTLSTTTQPHSSNDLENAGVQWVVAQSSRTTDYQTGETINRGFTGLKIETPSQAGVVHVTVNQYTLDEHIRRK